MSMYTSTFKEQLEMIDACYAKGTEVYNGELESLKRDIEFCTSKLNCSEDDLIIIQEDDIYYKYQSLLSKLFDEDISEVIESDGCKVIRFGKLDLGNYKAVQLITNGYAVLVMNKSHLEEFMRDWKIMIDEFIREIIKG